MGPKRRASTSDPRRKTRRPKRLTGLCSGCLDLEFNTMFLAPASNQRKYSETIFVKLRNSPEVDPDPCVFCSFLSSISPFDSSVNGVVQLQLSHADSEFSPLLKASKSTANVLRIHYANSFSGTQYFVSQSDPQKPIKTLEPDRFDYMKVKEWLKICQNLHSDSCKPAFVTIPNLQLIDCEMKTVVQALDHEYVTLSYLWGADSDSDSIPFTGSLPADMPRTIEDALTVTLKLGFRYLWVDRYCIDQANSSAHLRLMGSIYRNSQLTIIAAAGSDPTYGLPGVGEQHRRPPPSTQIGDIYLRAVRRMDQIVHISRWSSRGWTYQEGILATRRLVFTSHDLYFECHGMCCHESFSLPYRKMHSNPGSNSTSRSSSLDAGSRSQGQRFQEKFFAIPPGSVGERIGIFPAGYGGQACDIYIHIARYSLRDLSHVSDRLRAFLGILEAFEIGRHKVRHHFGVPIIPSTASSQQHEAEEQQGKYGHTYSKTCFVFGLMWGCKFRDDDLRVVDAGLPSWSWVGVKGSVEFDYSMGDGSFLDADQTVLLEDLDVSFERREGEMVSWETFHAEYETLSGVGMMAPYIHIEAWSAKAKILPNGGGLNEKEKTGKSVKATKSVSDGYRVLCIEMEDGSLIEHELFSPNTNVIDCEVLVLGTSSEELFMLVVHEVKEETAVHWERVQKIFPGAHSDEKAGSGVGAGVLGWSVKEEFAELDTLDNRDKKTHFLPRDEWGEEWWKFMKGGRRKGFRLG